MAEMAPAEVFPPGDFLLEELEARGWSQVEFAEILDRPLRLVNQIVNGKARITEQTANEIAAALGTSPDFWLNLEKTYRLWRTEPAPPRIAQRARLRERCPLRDMINRGWIQNSESVEVLEAEVLRFLEIDTLDERPPIAFAAKQTDYEAELSPAQEAWLLRAKHLAAGMPCKAYSEGKLREAVEQMKTLLSDPEGIRHVPKLLADAGVRFVIVEQLPSLKVDGVCFWLDDNSPVIGMSLRYDRIDNFWFVLRHEIEHVLNRDGTVLDSDLDRKRDNLPVQEERANTAATDFCVPNDAMQYFMDRVGPLYTELRVIAFAKNIGVHPGLVAGQLRRRLERWTIFTKLLVKIRHIIIPNAVVDGFGSVLPDD